MPARSRRRSSCSASCRRASPGRISTLPAWLGRTRATARRRRAPRPMACACSTRGSPKITSADGVMATEVNFYHLTRSSLDAAFPRLLAKTLQAGERAVVMLGSPERVDALNTHLWTFDPNGFLPHGSARDGEAARQPVWLPHLDETPNGAAFLFVADRARSERMADYRRCFELFDGRDDTAVADSRERWKAYKAAGHTVIYWQKTATG